MPYVYKEPDVVATHTDTIVERDSSAGAILGIVLAALLVLGFIGYFAWWAPANSPDSGRAQEIRVSAPDVNVKAPDVNVNTPPTIINNPPPVQSTTGGTGSSGNGESTTTGGDAERNPTR